MADKGGNRERGDAWVLGLDQGDVGGEVTAVTQVIRVVYHLRYVHLLEIAYIRGMFQSGGSMAPAVALCSPGTERFRRSVTSH